MVHEDIGNLKRYREKANAFQAFLVITELFTLSIYFTAHDNGIVENLHSENTNTYGEVTRPSPHRTSPIYKKHIEKQWYTMMNCKHYFTNAITLQTLPL